MSYIKIHAENVLLDVTNAKSLNLIQLNTGPNVLVPVRMVALNAMLTTHARNAPLDMVFMMDNACLVKVNVINVLSLQLVTVNI